MTFFNCNKTTTRKDAYLHSSFLFNLSNVCTLLIEQYSCKCHVVSLPLKHFYWYCYSNYCLRFKMWPNWFKTSLSSSSSSFGSSKSSFRKLQTSSNPFFFPDKFKRLHNYYRFQLRFFLTEKVEINKWFGVMGNFRPKTTDLSKIH